MNLKIVSCFMGLLMLSNCVNADINAEIQEVEVEIAESGTNTATFLPEEYSFSRNGISTVYYTGQTARLKMATELKFTMNDISYTQEQLDAMFNFGTGFIDSTLDESGKNIGSKTAASPVASATVKPMFDQWIEEFTAVVVPAVLADRAASSGIAGIYTETDGSRTVKVTAKGFELNQIFSKGLIGALQLDQIINNYLSFSKLNGGREGNDNLVFEYTYPGEADPTITRMEHNWDEAFGYLNGLDSQFKSGLGDTVTGKDTTNLNYYLNKVNSQENEEGISDKIYASFIAGRAAIVNKDYEQRDYQAAIIATELSKVVGYKAQSYLIDGAEHITNGDWAAALHALSEAYGFILGLQFTKDATATAYMSNQEVNDLLERLAAGDGGFWERTPDQLIAMAEEVAAATGLTLP